MRLRGSIFRVLTCVLILSLSACADAHPSTLPPTQTSTATAQIPREFNGTAALRDVEYQVSLGPRLPGSQAHRQAGDWIVKELQAAGWQVEVQETVFDSGTGIRQPVRNIIAKWGDQDARPWLVLGAHYDTRLKADKDPDHAKRGQPVPGANDGASGVAALLELGRVLPGHADDLRYKQVWLLFIDAEDNGHLPGWDWILGSKAFVASLTSKPDAAVILDMIGDADLNVYMEKNSDAALTKEIWDTAARLGYGDKIISQPKYQILDDHLPFLQAGIPAVDMIDFDYPAWHTTSDTPDKVSAQSLEVIGRTLLAWLTTATP
jgi:Zn-dependent M28 family amino/carboxypeptidase